MYKMSLKSVVVSNVSLSKWKAKLYGLSQESILVIVLSDTVINNLDGGREGCPF